jgi:predicted metal-binding transcription factor (methanogenesis marker protein 9)
MKRFLLFIVIVMPLIVYGQSFVFCPDIKTEVKRDLNNINISLVFKDSRSFAKKVKEKCTKNEIFNEFVNCIKRTYPSIKISVLDENTFDVNPQKDSITIKINLLQYDATFYLGMYIAYTTYELKIFDYRKGEKLIVDSIIKGEGKQFNLLGLKSGKIASNSSFKDAFDRFVSLTAKLSQESITEKVDSNLNKNIPKSKADKLRELKKLLDDKILTQEEFDKEKKKILDEKDI